jgi:inorganic phosphate transporter, PiT family
MPEMPLWVGITVATALLFAFMNGFHDTANAIATSVLTRALSIRQAIVFASGLNFLGALVSIKVATTIGKGIVDPSNTTNTVVLSALIGGIAWLFITWYFGLPTSCSHALVGGVVGAVLADHTTLHTATGTLGWTLNYGVLQVAGLEKILMALLLSPIFGVVFALILMIALLHVFGRCAPSLLNRHFRRLQVMSAGFMAFSHGSNDAQQVMGVITLTLVSSGILGTFAVPLWVKVISATAMALGTAVGGWRIIKTVGRKVMELKPIHGFAAETAAASVIQLATHFGAPVSTTHVISTAIMGVGMSHRLTAVRWGVVGQIVGAWILTMPMAMLFAALTYWLIHGWL